MSETIRIGKYSFYLRSLMMIICFQVMIFQGAGTALALSLPPLHEAESMVGDGPEVLAAISAMARDAQLRELEHQRMGAKYFFTATFGYSDEPLFETSEESASYRKLGIGAGLVFPLFGTWSKQKIKALELEITSIESKYRPRIMKLHNLNALRKAYVTLWSECEKIAMAERFLKTEQDTSKILFEREDAGLLLPADRLEFLTAYDMAARDIAVSDMRKTQAIQIIRLATGKMWDMPQKMEIPTLPAFGKLRTDIENHPEIAMRRETLKKYEKLLHEKRSIDREGSFTIGATAAKDFPGEIGTGVYASVTINEPLGTAFSKEDKIKMAAADDLKRAQLDEIFMKIKVQGEAEEAASLAAYAVANIRAQESRLAALTEGVRERIMRHASIAGDTFEQLQKSRYQYYRGAMDLLDSEMIFIQTGADLLYYAYPDGLLSEPSERIRPIVDNPLRSRMLDPDWLTSKSDVPGGNARILTSDKPAVTQRAETVTKPKMPDIAMASILVEKPVVTERIETGTKTKISDISTASISADKPAVTKKTEAATKPEMPNIPTANIPVGSHKTNQTVSPEKDPRSEEAVSTGAVLFQNKSVYIWDASPFLAPETRISSLEELRRNGFDHFLISFTAEQIKNFENYYYRMELEDLLSAANSMGIRADLLLGEPTWIYPDERKGLLKILEKMKNYKFKGIHLDIEPDSLPGAEGKREEFLGLMIDTLREVKNVTDLSLSISVHPRYLEGNLGVLSSRGLAKLGLEYIAVMIYTTNSNTVIARMKNIMIMMPFLNFRLAQSVEKVLSPEESYFSLGIKNYSDSMGKICNALGNSKGFNGVIIQAWEDLGGMHK